MDRDSVIPLIEQWERFIKISKTTGLREFAEWLLSQQELEKPGIVEKPGVAGKNEEYLAANYVSRLNKYVKAYVKPLLHDNRLANADEFSILSLISQMDRPTKREVSKANLMELSTGVDMIRRLLKANYIKEETHENDARAKRLTLTKDGRDVLMAVYNRLADLEHKVLGDLPIDDKTELLRLLDYLNKYHERVYFTLNA